LLALSSTSLGEAVFKNQRLATDILSSGALSARQQLLLAGAVNSEHLSSSSRVSRKIDDAGLLKTTVPPSDPGVATTTRTWSVGLLGDVKPDPPIIIPVMRFGQNKVQINLDSIPAGKSAAGTFAAACVAKSCLDDVKDYEAELSALLSSTDASDRALQITTHDTLVGNSSDVYQEYIKMLMTPVGNLH
jgi:hypothetical protein